MNDGEFSREFEYRYNNNSNSFDDSSDAFVKNLRIQLSNEYGIGALTKEQLEEFEQSSFTVDDKLLSLEECLYKELRTISAVFTHGTGEGFRFQKYNDLRLVICDLNYLFRYCRINYGENVIDPIALKVLEITKRILVHLQLELGIDVNFVTILYDMVEKGVLDLSYNDYAKMDHNEHTEQSLLFSNNEYVESAFFKVLYKKYGNSVK